MTARGPGYRLQVDALDDLAISVAMCPQQSVVSLLLQAGSGRSKGAPAGLLAEVGKTLRPQARFAVRPLTAVGFTLLPDCCTPIRPLADTSVAQQARRLRDLPAEVLTDELTAHGGNHFPPGWRVAGDQPRRWLNSMADASLDTWDALKPRWRAAGPLLDREIRRIGTAAVRGGLWALLNSLHPLLSYRDGFLTFAVPFDRCVPLGRRRLVLVPMTSGHGSVHVDFEGGDLCYVGYPVRPPGPGALAAANGGLDLVLGPLRAAAMRALRQSLTVGELAAAIQCAPTTATYHVHLLAAADLVACERRGSSVLVSRTVRGHEMVDLLSDLLLVRRGRRRSGCRGARGCRAT